MNTVALSGHIVSSTDEPKLHRAEMQKKGAPRGAEKIWAGGSGGPAGGFSCLRGCYLADWIFLALQERAWRLGTAYAAGGPAWLISLYCHRQILGEAGARWKEKAGPAGGKVDVYSDKRDVTRRVGQMLSGRPPSPMPGGHLNEPEDFFSMVCFDFAVIKYPNASPLHAWRFTPRKMAVPMRFSCQRATIHGTLVSGLDRM